METGSYQFSYSDINSLISFRPLVEALKKNISQGNPSEQKLFGPVIAAFESQEELMQPMTDLSAVSSHLELIGELLSMLFPPIAAAHENIYAVTFPFQFKSIYSSKLFHHLFLKPGSNEINIPGDEIGQNLYNEKLRFASSLILKKFCGYNGPDTTRAIYPSVDPRNGLTKFFELKIDNRFIDVRCKDAVPRLPDSLVNKQSNQIKSIDELTKDIPLDKFIFEGIALLRVNDVTEEEVISQIKSSLLNINAFADATVYTELEKHIQSLVGMKDVRIGITPFFRVNGHYVYSELHNSNSHLFRHFHNIADKDEISDCCKLLFRDSDQPVLFETLNEKTLSEIEYLQYYYMENGRSLIICPLKQHNELLGILEIVSEIPGKLRPIHVSKIEAAIHLFTLALEKSMESLVNQVDRVIKEQFTAVQPSVEWKFTEVALNYIVNHQRNEEVKMERICFPDVFPLYGAIDIRNSSTERSRSIQLDMVEQLEMSRNVLKRAQADMPFPLLQEIEFKIDKYIASAAEVLQSNEEIEIHNFLQGQVISIFNHLQNTQPSIAKEVGQYFGALDPQLNMIYHHRKEYEQSISKINDTLARFIDKEQVAAQKAFPHYFERYVTDGIEFNIYMGQSISPKKKFDEIYLRNMRMWQLTVLAKAARVTHHMEQHLSHPLKTTQLILAHSIPLSISFRTEEKKFDVDGAYNVRYEIIKKRIDKVRIKDTNERLTQPAKVAIVYSQAKDAAEYMEYIEFLQNQNLIKPGVEQHDLEELQGVVGLKALRVEVNLEHDHKHDGKVELSNITTQQLIGK
ncbi:MAG: hypothetical protein JST17_07770 [Bacteroidetes bacterium]|nr:hypothetical protein [Bacteroidota bacterium]MBS1931582.1 hypothetical protein [Bacteroidota bacterium]